MKRKIQLSENDKIFCNGVFLQPFEVQFDNGKKQWHWVLVGSEDDSYLNGERVYIYDYANDLQSLLVDEE